MMGSGLRLTFVVFFFLTGLLVGGLLTWINGNRDLPDVVALLALLLWLLGIMLGVAIMEYVPTLAEGGSP